MSSLTIVKCDQCKQEIPEDSTTVIKIVPAKMTGICWDGNADVEPAIIMFHDTTIHLTEQLDFCDHRCFTNWLP